MDPATTLEAANTAAGAGALWDIPAAIFFLFAGLMTVSALGVITVRNPVYAVLLLIFCFFNAAGLFILLGAEYIAMTLVIVYVGAVAILFLFVVMMLDIKFAEMKRGFVRYMPLGGGLALLMIAELYYLLGPALLNMPSKPEGKVPLPPASEANNAEAIGQVLYTNYAYLFQIAGLILLVAMIGAIVLTHRTRGGVRRQSIAKQVARRRKDGVTLVDVETGRGV